MSQAKLQLVETLKDERERASLHRPTTAEAEEAVRTLIAFAGDDPTREGVLETPARVARSYSKFFSSYLENPVEVLERTFENPTVTMRWYYCATSILSVIANFIWRRS